MQVKSLDHLTLTISDIEKTLFFYVDILGMQPDTTNNRYAVKFGRQKINFHLVKNQYLPAAKNPEYGSADLCLLVDTELIEVQAYLEKNKINVEEGIVTRNGALGKMQSLYIRDPDGNLLELSKY